MTRLGRSRDTTPRGASTRGGTGSRRALPHRAVGWREAVLRVASAPLGSGRARHDRLGGRASTGTIVAAPPLLAPSLEGLPPRLVITAGCDPVGQRTESIVQGTQVEQAELRGARQALNRHGNGRRIVLRGARQFLEQEPHPGATPVTSVSSRGTRNIASARSLRRSSYSTTACGVSAGTRTSSPRWATHPPRTAGEGRPPRRDAALVEQGRKERSRRSAGPS